MIVEYIRYQLVAHKPEELIAAYERAARQLQAAPDCLGYELAICDDDPGSCVLRIEWKSFDGHMLGFRKGPHFPPFLAEIKPFIGEIAEMRHYSVTTVRSSGRDARAM